MKIQRPCGHIGCYALTTSKYCDGHGLCMQYTTIRVRVIQA
jgi:hypothetical protein